MANPREVYGTPRKDPVVLKLSKLIRPEIGLTLAMFASTTKNLIEEANKLWGVKLLPANVRICSKPYPLAL
jgi:hypothetical protein